MTAYSSLELTPPIYPVSGVGMGGRSTHNSRGQYTTLATLVTGDTVALFDLPPRARITGGFIKTDQLDTSTGLTLSVGTAGTPALFFNASTIGRTAGGGVDRNMAFAGTDYLCAGAKTRVILTATAGATTGANGTVVVELSYLVEEPA